MATRLKSVFRSRQSLLVLKALIFWGFLGLHWSGGGVISAIFFILAALILYCSPISRTSHFFFTFASLLIVALSIVSVVAPIGFLIVSIFLAFLFYCLLAVKNLIFVNRSEWHFALVLAIIYLAFVVFFSADQSSWFIFRSLIFYILTVMLIRELLLLSMRVVLIISFFLIESVWMIGFLPLGFINAANLSLLVCFSIIDSLRHYLRGTLTNRVILTRITILVLGMLLIFGVTIWRI